MPKKFEIHFYLAPIMEMLSKLQTTYYVNIDETLLKLVETEDFEILKKSVIKIIQTSDRDSELLMAVERLHKLDRKQVEPGSPFGFPKFYNTIEAAAIVLKSMHNLKNDSYNDDKLDSLLEQSIKSFMEYTIKITERIYNFEIEKKQDNEKSVE